MKTGNNKTTLQIFHTIPHFLRHHEYENFCGQWRTHGGGGGGGGSGVKPPEPPLPQLLSSPLPATAVLFFRSVQLSNIISRNFYYHAMQQYRYFNFFDVFCLNYIFVIDAAVKQLVSRSFLQCGASAVTMAAHKI